MADDDGKSDERCPKCGALISLVGRRHLCRGDAGRSPSVGGDILKKTGDVVSNASSMKRKNGNQKRASVRRKAVSSARRRLRKRGPRKGTGGRPRKGHEAKTLTRTKPWEKQGISQRTWYRLRELKESRRRARERANKNR